MFDSRIEIEFKKENRLDLEKGAKSLQKYFPEQKLTISCLFSICIKYK
jgi:hypothetical protein